MYNLIFALLDNKWEDKDTKPSGSIYSKNVALYMQLQFVTVIP